MFHNPNRNPVWPSGPNYPNANTQERFQKYAVHVRFILDAGLVQQSPYSDAGQLRGNYVLQGSSHAPEGGARGIDDDNFSFTHGKFPSPDLLFQIEPKFNLVARSIHRFC